MALHFAPIAYLLRKGGYRAIALWPLVFVAEEEMKSDPHLMNHENIHLAQQAEMLVLPFYGIYLWDYVRGRAAGLNHDQAYRGIRFEKEAYAKEKEKDYLSNRKPWAAFDYSHPDQSA